MTLRCITSHKTSGDVLALYGAIPYNRPMATETAETILARLCAACPAAFPGSDLAIRATRNDRQRVVVQWRNLRVECDTESEARERLVRSAEDTMHAAVGIWQTAARKARAEEENHRLLALLMEQQVDAARRVLPRARAAA